MLDEEQINKRIQEAAESYEPTYDDKAWKEMERLLDEHLPQQKDKRRIAFLLLLFLIPAAGIYFGARYKNARDTQVLQNTILVARPGITADNKSKNGATLDKINEPKTTAAQENGIYKTNLNNRKQNLSAQLPLDKGADNVSTENMTSNVVHKSSSGNIENTSLISPSEENISSALPDVTNTQTNHNVSPDKEKAVTNKDAGDKDSLNKNFSNNKSNNKKISGNHFPQNFSIGITVGPDVSAVKLKNTGKVTLILGVQAAYRISDKFTLRSGFLIAKKIYSAAGGDYHWQSSTPNYYLQTVDADCKVYEIPLTLSYNFGKTKTHEWFVSAGLSSYFMKKESYEYFYKYPSGYTDTKYYSVSNKNKYYFSVLNLSAGYEYTVNKRISIVAEPYIKAPVTGIGIGKIKLNSAGVLFSLKVKPF